HQRSLLPHPSTGPGTSNPRQSSKSARGLVGTATLQPAIKKRRVGACGAGAGPITESDGEPGDHATGSPTTGGLPRLSASCPHGADPLVRLAAMRPGAAA